MKRSIIIIDAFTAFVIGAGSAAVAALVAGNGKLNVGAMVAIAFAGAVTAAKSTRSLLSLPPLANGNADALQKMLNQQPTTEKGKE